MKLLQEMAVVGSSSTTGRIHDEKQYILPMYVPGSAEFMVMNKGTGGGTYRNR